MNWRKVNWEIGKKLQNGRYEIKRKLGEGGFGITYKAWHVYLKGYVVIKIPLDGRDMPNYQKYLAQFRAEGQILEQLSQTSHPHIVRVRDLFEEEQIPCLVMDYIRGENLHDYVAREGALSEAEAIIYIRQIAEALCVIHNRNLVHRDVHPGNIILRDSDQYTGKKKAILIDFGIAQELAVSSRAASIKAGHPNFAPYEQLASGASGSRKPTVDVYSLSATLYYAVTGEPPTGSRDREQGGHLVPLKKLNPKISDRLNRAILRGMELEAKNRPQLVQEWLKLIEKTNVPIGERLQSGLMQLVSASRRVSSKTSEENEEEQVISYTLQSRYPFYPEPTLRQGRSIPWDWLMFPFTGFVAAGFIFSQLVGLQALSMSLLMSVSAWLSSLAWAVSGILTNVRANNGEWSISNQWVRAWNRTLFNFLESIKDSTLLLTWFIIGVLVSRSIFIWARGQYWTMVLTGFAFIVAAITDVRRYRLGIYIGGRLLQSFGRLETFLILVGISAIGLTLGWLVGLAL